MLSFKIALQFLKHNIAKSLVTLVAISFGIAIFYFILDISSGLKITVLSATANADAHIRIQTDVEFYSFADDESIALRNAIFDVDNTITDVSFSYRTNITYRPSTSATDKIIEVRGVDFDYGRNIVQIRNRITDHKENKIPEPVTNSHINYDGEIAVGSKFLNNNNNDNNNLLNRVLTFRNMYGEVFRLKIVAVFTTDQENLATNIMFTDIKTAQLIGNSNIINFIEIRTKDPVKSNIVTPKIKEFSQNNFSDFIVSDWQTGSQYIVNLLYLEDISILLIQLMTGFAISFGVGSVLMFQAKQKINQVGILKALGLRDLDTQLIFFYQALVLSVIGLVIGLIFGHGLSQGFMLVFRRASGGPLVRLQFDFINFYSILTFVIMLPVNLIASYIPIRFVKKLKIIEVIKHD